MQSREMIVNTKEKEENWQRQGTTGEWEGNTDIR